MDRLTIGKLAQAGGVSTDTIRFYERCGLIISPARTAANYRLYPEKRCPAFEVYQKGQGSWLYSQGSQRTLGIAP